MRKSVISVLGASALAVGWALLPQPAAATLVDPPIQIGSGLGTTACPIPNGTSGPGCHDFGVETNVFGNTLDMFYTSNTNSGVTDNPVLLILAVPNDSTTTPALGAGAVSSATLFTPSQYNATTGAIISPGTAISTIGFGTTSYGLDGNGQEGLMTSSKPKDIYSFLGAISPTISGDASNNFANLSGADASIGITATNFGIYVYALDTSSFDNKDIIDVSLSVPKGTFAVAWDENAQNLFGTPFTEAGWDNGTGSGGGGGGGGGNVPEPSTVAVFAAGLLGLGYAMHRRRSA